MNDMPRTQSSNFELENNILEPIKKIDPKNK